MKPNKIESSILFFHVRHFSCQCHPEHHNMKKNMFLDSGEYEEKIYEKWRYWTLRQIEMQRNFFRVAHESIFFFLIGKALDFLLEIWRMKKFGCILSVQIWKSLKNVFVPRCSSLANFAACKKSFFFSFFFLLFLFRTEIVSRLTTARFSIDEQVAEGKRNKWK